MLSLAVLPLAFCGVILAITVCVPVCVELGERRRQGRSVVRAAMRAAKRRRVRLILIQGGKSDEPPVTQAVPEKRRDALAAGSGAGVARIASLPSLSGLRRGGRHEAR